ncbi:toxin-antitoxin system HicB family antitoxin [Chloroflexota bacterium]
MSFDKVVKTSTRTTLYLPEELHAAVKIEAAKQRISMTKLIIQAVEYELERLAGKQESRRTRK